MLLPVARVGLRTRPATASRACGVNYARARRVEACAARLSHLFTWREKNEQRGRFLDSTQTLFAALTASSRRRSAAVLRQRFVHPLAVAAPERQALVAATEDRLVLVGAGAVEDLDERELGRLGAAALPA